MIRKAGVPVVPVAIDGWFRGLAEGKDVISCPPDPDEIWEADGFQREKGEQIVRELEDELRRLLGELRAEA